VKHRIERPLAIAMWDFSWLERRWPGAGYEDWDQALDELAARGYDAVRIDAYPHLLSASAERVWELLPVWNQSAWGAQSKVRVRVGPELREFIARCRNRNILVGLSTWNRLEASGLRNGIRTPVDHARIWRNTLGYLDEAGLLDALLYVDFSNEFPVPFWTPYLYDGNENAPSSQEKPRTSPEISSWMREAIGEVARRYPALDYTYSFCSQYRDWKEQDVSMLDFLEPHIWMSHPETSDWNARVGYNFEKFDPVGFEHIVDNGYRIYKGGKSKYDAALIAEIDNVAAWSRASGKPLITTECWAVVDYKDWPGLDWGWVKDLTAMGVAHAAAQGRWVAIATSNFCGPQFVGMWRDIAWHRRLTDLIKSSPIDADLKG
jgi:hypothetical protein